MKFRISCIFFQVLAFVVEDAHQHSMEMCYAPTRWIHATTRWVFSLLMWWYSTLEIRAKNVLFSAAPEVRVEYRYFFKIFCEYARRGNLAETLIMRWWDICVSFKWIWGAWKRKCKGHRLKVSTSPTTFYRSILIIRVEEAALSFWLLAEDHKSVNFFP